MAPPKRQQRTQALDNLGDPPAGYVLTGDPDAEAGVRWTAPDVSAAVGGAQLGAADGLTLLAAEFVS
jgi:hypothetical protein